MARNITLPSGNNLVFPSTNNAVFAASFLRKERGAFYVYASFDGIQKGRARIANDAVEGYVVYIGYGDVPDFTLAPDDFSTSRPIDVSVTPPGAGTENIHVVLRKRNKYKLESQNQQSFLLTIDTNGDEVLGDVSAPSDATILPADDENFLVSAIYNGFENDANPANTWYVYLKADSPPVPGVDSPVATGVILDTRMSARLGTYPTGDKTYYLAITVHRTVDDVESTAAEASLVLDADPLTPEPVPGQALAHS